MKLAISCAVIFCCFFYSAYSQVCTFTASGNVNWPGGLSCSEAGVTPATASVLVIPAGLTVVFNSGDDTWTGVIIHVYGTLRIAEPSGITLNTSIQVKNGGLLDLDHKLTLGNTSTSCDYGVGVETGGSVRIDGNASDRLIICGTNVAQGGGGCKPYPGPNLPYCAPSGGFTGPTGFDKTGHNPSLPVTWLSFNARSIDHKSVYLTWATASEWDAESFIIERSTNGKDFFSVGSIAASGTSNTRKDYAFTDTSPFVGRTYYRLRQIDFDGVFSYSDIRFVDLDGRRAASVFPNPLQKEELNVQLNFSDEYEVFVSVVDVSGHEIDRFSFFGSAFSRPLTLNSGAYLLKVKTGKDNLVCRFVVK